MEGTLTRKLRVLRAERQLSLREAAKLAGVRPATLSELERGRRHPHDLTLSRIARAYDVPVDELIEEEPVASPLAEAPSRPPREETAGAGRVSDTHVVITGGHAASEPTAAAGVLLLIDKRFEELTQGLRLNELTDEDLAAAWEEIRGQVRQVLA
jgi:transcriptional regulator with XRE-family HTH domain